MTSSRSWFRKKSTLRLGMTLTELIVVMSMMAVVLSSVTVALAGVTKAVRNQRTADEAAQSAGRLTHQFRSDVHQSQGPIDVTAGKLVCRLPDDIEVTYTLPSPSAASGTIERIEQSGSRILRRRNFPLAAGERASLSSRRADEQLVIELHVDRESKSGGWRVIALAPGREETP
jgi:type II secretory pathway pseudopilin PulG